MVTDLSDDPKKNRRTYEKATPTQLTKEEAKGKLIDTPDEQTKGQKSSLK